MGLDILRIILLGGFVGFAVFCVSYATSVWLRRNGGDLRGVHPLSLIGPGVAIAGTGFLGFGFVTTQIAHMTGIVDGSDIFVEVENDETQRPFAIWLTETSAASRYDLQEVFGPYPASAQINALSPADRAARARLGALSTTPLRIDPALIQRQAQLRAQIDQQNQFRFDLQRARRDLNSQLADLNSGFDREQTNLTSEKQVADRERAAYAERIVVALRQLRRAEDLVARGAGSPAIVDERRAALLSLTSEQERFSASIEAIDERLRKAAELYHGLASQKRSQLGEVAADLAAATTVIETLEAEIASVESMIAEDGERAVLAASSGAGFTVTASLPKNVIKPLQSAGPISFVAKDVPTDSRFVGAFREAQVLEGDPSRAIVKFDVKLPADILAVLRSSTSPLVVKLNWRPPLMSNGGALIGLSMLLIGAVFWFHGFNRRARTDMRAVIFLRSSKSSESETKAA